MNQDVQEELQKLKLENEQLKAQQNKASTIHFKVSQKGAVSVYGLGRFPVTLYKEQWLRLLDQKEGILDFISENEGDLKTKN